MADARACLGSRRPWMIVVPILFLEFLVIALPAGVLPIIINEHFGARSYMLLGYSQALRGLLAFLASPALGALSDVIGRKYLFVACVVGSSAPYALLGLGASLEVHSARRSLSPQPEGTPPTKSLFSAFVCPRSAVFPPESANRTCNGLRRGGNERWLCSACIAFCAAVKLEYLTKQQPCAPRRAGGSERVGEDQARAGRRAEWLPDAWRTSVESGRASIRPQRAWCMPVRRSRSITTSVISPNSWKTARREEWVACQIGSLRVISRGRCADTGSSSGASHLRGRHPPPASLVSAPRIA